VTRGVAACGACFALLVASGCASTSNLADSSPAYAGCLGPGQTRLPAWDEWVSVQVFPEAIEKAEPAYPDGAWAGRVDGTVVVAALVCVDGSVRETHMRKSIPMLDRAAMDAVGRWKFRPAKVGGQPIATWVLVPVRFSLH
jgi:protein TonB